jgi:hypothetical protein
MTTGNPVTVVNTSSNPIPVTITALENVNAQTGTSYTIATTDVGQLVTFSNGSAIAVTLPQATTTGYTVGFWFDVVNLGVGAVTITPATSTIQGAATLVLSTGQGSRIVSDGTNYFVQPGSTSADATVVRTSGTQSIAGTKTFSGVFVLSNASVSATAIPTADPHVVGRIWANSGVLTISAG